MICGNLLLAFGGVIGFGCVTREQRASGVDGMQVSWR